MIGLGKLGRVFRSDAMSTLIVRVAGIGLATGATALTAIALGPAEYGVYSAAMAAGMVLANFAPLGTDRIAVRNLSVVPTDEVAGEIAVAHYCLLVPGLVMTALAAVCGWISGSVFERADWATTCWLTCLLLPPMCLSFLRQWIAIPLIGTRRAVMPEQVLQPLATLVTMVILFVFSSAASAPIAAAIYSISTFIIWFGTLQGRELGAAYRAALNARLEWRAVRIRLLEGGAFVLVAAGAIFFQKSMPLVVAAGSGFASAGQFSIAMMIATVPGIPLGILSLSTVPTFARLYQQGRMQEAQAEAHRGAMATAATAIFVSCLIQLVSPWLLAFDPRFLLAGQLLPILLLAVIADCMTGPTIPVMQTMGLERQYSRTLLAWIPFHLLLVFAGGRMLGAEGSALGYLAGRILWNAILVVLIRRHRGILMIPAFRRSLTSESAAGLTVGSFGTSMSTSSPRSDAA